METGPADTDSEQISRSLPGKKVGVWGINLKQRRWEMSKLSGILKKKSCEREATKQCSVQFRSFAQLCPTLCEPMNCSTPGLPVHHQLLEFTQTHVHPVSDAIQPSHPLSSPSPPAPSPAQHQGLFQSVNSLHEVAKVLEFQPQHQSFQWISRTDLL